MSHRPDEKNAFDFSWTLVIDYQPGMCFNQTTWLLTILSDQFLLRYTANMDRQKKPLPSKQTLFMVTCGEGKEDVIGKNCNLKWVNSPGHTQNGWWWHNGAAVWQLLRNLYIFPTEQQPPLETVKWVLKTSAHTPLLFLSCVWACWCMNDL